MQMSRFTFGKPSKAVCAADEKAIRRPAASFVRRRLRQKQQKRRQPGLMRIAARDMKFCCSLMKCAKKRGVARAGCRYNKGRPYICFRPTRLVGGVESPPAHRGSPATLQSTHGGGAYALPNHGHGCGAAAAPAVRKLSGASSAGGGRAPKKSRRAGTSLTNR